MEDLAPNRVTVEMNKRYARKTEVAKIFSQKDGVRKPLTVEKRKDGMLMVKISSAGTTAIPVVLLMRSLGIDNDQEIFQAIAGPTETFKFIVANLNEVKDNEEYNVENQEEAMQWLEKKFAAGQQKEYREQRIQNLLDKVASIRHTGVNFDAAKQLSSVGKTGANSTNNMHREKNWCSARVSSHVSRRDTAVVQRPQSGADGNDTERGKPLGRVRVGGKADRQVYKWTAIGETT